MEEENNGILEKIYYGDFNPAKEIPKEKEYQEILAKIKKFITKIRENEKDVEKINLFDELMETLAIKDGMEAENQFKLGFQLATKLIIEGME